MYARAINKATRAGRDLATRRVPCDTGPAGAEKTGLVLYLDYEREFARKDAARSAQKGFTEILRILNSYGVAATWNCVGLIGEYYPETIHQLLYSGQEIASHTHRHIVPAKTRRALLLSDLQVHKRLFKDRFGVSLRGFHSPQDNWSSVLIEILAELGFHYDIAVETRSHRWGLSRLTPRRPTGRNGERGIVRIPSLGDDWKFVSEDLSPSDMLLRWLRVFDPQFHGKTIALGVHPWVVGQKEERIAMFEAFVGAVVGASRVETFTGSQIADWCNSNPGDQEIRGRQVVNRTSTMANSSVPGESAAGPLEG